MLLDKFLFSTLLFVIFVSADDEVQVEIAQGKLIGSKATTVLEKKPYYSFKGIPYAKPNVGLDKFRVSGNNN